MDGNTIHPLLQKKMSYYKTGKELLELVGVARDQWFKLPRSEQLGYIEAAGVYAADWAAAGLISFGEDWYHKGYAQAKADYYTDKAFRQQRRQETQRRFEQAQRRAYLEELREREDYSLRPKKRLRGSDSDEWLNAAPTPARSYEDVRYDRMAIWDRYDEIDYARRQGDENADAQWLQMNPDTNILQETSAPMSSSMDIDNSGMRGGNRNRNYGTRNRTAILSKFQGTRTKSMYLTKRRASRNATYEAAIRRYWAHRMPLLTMRTYPAAHWQITASSGAQGVIDQQTVTTGTAPNQTTSTRRFHEDMCFPTKYWCFKILDKMQKDMAVPSGNTPGDGQVTNTLDSWDTLRENYQRNGLSILGLTRSYQFMNTVNAVGFLEVYEYVWKGTTAFSANPSSQVTM